MGRLRQRACFLTACGYLLFVITAQTAEVILAGPRATWRNLVVITNSVRSAVVLVDANHTLVSTSAVDSCLSLLPDWTSWRPVTNGTLDIWLETVNDGSNLVTVLLGEPETPALSIFSGSDWSIWPVGEFPTDDPISPRLGVATNRLHLALHSSGPLGFSHVFLETQVAGGPWLARPGLIPAKFIPLDVSQTIRCWPKVGVECAGPRAALTVLRMRWCVDGTVFIAR